MGPLRKNLANSRQETRRYKSKYTTTVLYHPVADEKSDSSSADEDPYKSVGFLGAGGFGSVDKVYKGAGNKQQFFARKRFRQPHIRSSQREKILKELQDEARILRSISFRHVVRLIDSYTWKDHFCLIMSPVADTHLGDILSNIDTMTVDDPQRHKAREMALQWPCCLIRAMDYLHEMRIKHRDIKPSNILVKDGTVYLADFGISKVVVEEETTGSLGSVGPHTYMYSAPEVIAEENTRRGRATDIYSLGCVFLELCTAVITPPGSRALFTRLRLERSATQAYAHNEMLILQWILHIWAYWTVLVQDEETDDEPARLAGPWPDFAFLMLDPDPVKRITARQLVAMMVHPRLYYVESMNGMGCEGCSVKAGYEDQNLPLHSEFKGPDELVFAQSPEHALQILPAPDWESTKREWLKHHMWWT